MTKCFFFTELSEILLVRLIIKKCEKKFCIVCCSPHGRELEESELIPSIVEKNKFQTPTAPPITEPKKGMHIRALVITKDHAFT